MAGGGSNRERVWRAVALGLLGALAWQLGSAALLPRRVIYEDRLAVPPAIDTEVTAEPLAGHTVLAEVAPTLVATEPAATPAPRVLRVGSTGGVGAYVRGSPRMSDRLRAWPDGTPMHLTGEEAEAEGRHWRQVRAPDGTVGWLPSGYLIP